MDAHETSKRMETRPRFDWVVTRPDGRRFQMTASEWIMATYYNVPGWSYERVSK